VAVEGAVGVGKTTVAAYLAAALGAVHLHFPPEFLRFRSEARLDERMHPIPRLAYYLAATAELSEMVRAELPARPVVCDRYLVTPLSLLEAEGALERAEIDRLATPILSHILVPDLTLLLLADHGVASQRARARERPEKELTAVHRRALDSAAFFGRWQETYRREAARIGPVVEMDTTALSVEETCSAAAARVLELSKGSSG